MGEMNAAALAELLKAALSAIDGEGAAKKEPEPVKEPAGDSWYLKTAVYSDKLHVYLMHDGKLVSSGYSEYKEGLPEPVKMAQAFSYAAHMAYKHLKWAEEFGDAKQG